MFDPTKQSSEGHTGKGMRKDGQRDLHRSTFALGCESPTDELKSAFSDISKENFASSVNESRDTKAGGNKESHLVEAELHDGKKEDDGQRNLHSSTFSINSNDDSEDGKVKTSIRIKQPPGGASSGLW